MADANNPTPTPAPVQPAAGQFTADQLHQAVEKARMEEREKLRQQLDAANTKVTELNGQVAQFTTKVGELTASNTKLTEELASIKASIKPDGGIDIEKAISSAVTAAVHRVSSEFQGKLETVQSELATERSSRHQLTLEQTRARLIQVHGGEGALIPELVAGSNEAELLASIERSKQVFQRTVGSINPGGTPPSLNPITTTGGTVPVVVPPVVVPAGQPGGGNPVPAAAPSGRLPLGEYAKVRDTLRKQVASRYPKAVMTQ